MHALDVLGDPVRRRLLVLLSEGELSSGELARVIGDEFGISHPAVSQHLKVLRDNGFTTVRAEGTRLTITAGAPDHADLVITTQDAHLHRLLIHQLTPAEAVATGAVTLDGDTSALPRLTELFAFPATLDPTAGS